MKRLFLIIFSLCVAVSADNTKYNEYYNEPNLDVTKPSSFKIEVESKPQFVDKKLMFFVLSGDKKIIDQSLRLALNSIKDGVDVEMVFGAYAVKYLSRLGYQSEKMGSASKNIKKLVEEIIKYNGKVFVYEESRRDFGTAESNYIKGVGIMPGTKIISNVLLKNMKVITF